VKNIMSDEETLREVYQEMEDLGLKKIDQKGD